MVIGGLDGDDPEEETDFDPNYDPSHPCTKPNKREWMHAFRIGCSREVRSRMRQQHLERWKELEQQAKQGQKLLNDGNSGQALVVINNSLMPAKKEVGK